MERKSEENFWEKQNQKFFKLESCRCEQENIELKEVKSSGETKKKGKENLRKKNCQMKTKRYGPKIVVFVLFPLFDNDVTTLKNNNNN